MESGHWVFRTNGSVHFPTVYVGIWFQQLENTKDPAYESFTPFPLDITDRESDTGVISDTAFFPRDDDVAEMTDDEVESLHLKSTARVTQS